MARFREAPATRGTEELSHLPGEVGIWIFVMGDLCLFLLFFLTYLYYRSGDVDLFLTSQQRLDRSLGLLNTWILLTSSYFVAGMMRHVRDGNASRAKGMLGAAIACGLAFVVTKVVEYVEKFDQGLTPTSNTFFNLYFMLTGIHLVHVLVGTGVLTYMLMHIRRTRVEHQNHMFLEAGATFWHMVDLIWIVLFPLLYLLH